MTDRIRVAIIGAGPAGLGAAIEFQKLPFVDLKIYDQARALREIGTGISIQKNTWRMLDAMGASQNISRDRIFRPADGHSLQHRYEARNLEIVITSESDVSLETDERGNFLLHLGRMVVDLWCLFPCIG
jgi:salicylate hydroxylase